MRGLAACATLLAVLAQPQEASAREENGVSGQGSLDDVWCAVCHWTQADLFATSVHYRQGHMLCDDCHGGDPADPDPETAKAPATGFIGRPDRGQIAGLCGGCHKGPAEFFHQGPHHDPGIAGNPTCVTCHHNHGVLDATLALMDTACVSCHQQEPAPLQRAADLQGAIRAAKGRIAGTRVRFDSLRALEPGLARSAYLVEGAESALRDAGPRTHALDVALVTESLLAVDEELAAWGEAMDRSERSRARRRWALWGVWLFVAVNLLLLWVRRRQLPTAGEA